MRLNKVSLIIAGTCLCYLFTGCAKAPDAELAAAKAALQAAMDAEADKYMAKNFQNVKTAVESAEAEIAKQKQAFFLTRKYTRVTKTLKTVTEVATEIAKDAPEAKKNVIAQVKENLDLSKTMLKETAADIKKVSKKKDKSIIEAVTADLNTADSIARLAATEFDSGDIIKAEKSLGNVQVYIKRITDQLNKKPEDM